MVETGKRDPIAGGGWEQEAWVVPPWYPWYSEPKQMMEQTIPKKELAYYNQGAQQVPVEAASQQHSNHNNTKLHGGGFHGRINKSMMMNPHEFVQTPTKEEQPEFPLTSGPSTMVQAATHTFLGM
ncbi:hypothetical protein FRC10_005425, partial [Ceratobasidium sp. 414]